MYTFKTRCTEMVLDDNGYFSSVTVCGKEIASGKNPIVTVCRDGNIYLPTKAVKCGKTVSVFTEIGIVDISCAESDVCITFEILTVPNETYSIVLGPYTVNINDVVGEVIGVVQGNGVAFGIQSLNVKTVEGIPDEYAEKVSELISYADESTGITVCNISQNACAAAKTEKGSVLQLFCKRRDLVEYRKVNGVEKSLTLPLAEGDPDAKISGAKMAFFGCEQKDALARIGEIELEQGLPHPMFDGEWGKTARSAMASYLISDFDSESFDYVTDQAIKAGMKYIYSMGLSKNWGHFEWSDELAKNDEEMKTLVDRAERKGVHVGIHTLTNFTTTNDPYVTPVPSDHLLKMCELGLLSDIDASQTEIGIELSDYFAHPLSLNTVMIGKELIKYAEFENKDGETILRGCERGAFGTAAACHTAGEKVYRLWDYPYNTFFPDIILQDKYCDRLGELFNKCNLSQISFDGLEGCTYTGQDIYALTRFTNRCWKNWDQNVLNDASRLNHFNWHMHTRMNWGEPWGEAMRTGQVDGRIRNQDFFRRNLFPRMLGWFLIRLADKKFECSTLEDLEWALSEAAGFDGGYAMTINVKTLKKHGKTDVLLEAMKNWDTLRYKNVFTDEQKKKLRDPSTEWHLEKVSDNEYKLSQLFVSKHYTCMLSEMQPGQAGGSDWQIDTPYDGNVSIRLKVDGDGCIKNPIFKTAKGTIKFPCEIEDGQYLLFGSDGKAEITDKNFNRISEVIPQGSIGFTKGTSALAFACEHEKDETPDIDVRFIVGGDAETIELK